jgi:thymidylate kinase
MSRRGISVAILGPDGAGKTTLAANLAVLLDAPTRYVYLGIARRDFLDSALLRPLVGVKLLLRLADLLRRVQVARWHTFRGRVVVFDRYVYDALLPAAGASWRSRTRSALIARVARPADLALLLDVPAQVMFDRKGEHDPAYLEHQRRGYLALRDRLFNVVVLDGTRSAAEVARAAAERVQAELDARTCAWSRVTGSQPARDPGATTPRRRATTSATMAGRIPAPLSECDTAKQPPTSPATGPDSGG